MADWQDKVIDVLQILLNHTADISLETLCTLVSLNSRCRTALQQCRGQCHVRLELPDGQSIRWKQEKRQLRRFGSWMLKYAGLVASLEIDFDVNSAQEDTFATQQKYAAVLSACSPATAAAAAAAAEPGAGAAAGVLVGLPLRLQRFSISHVPWPALLEAVAAWGLRELHVYDLWLGVPLIHTFPTALGAVTSLCDLELLSLDAPDEIKIPQYDAGFVTAFERLSHLTRLVIDADVSAIQAGDEQHLPKALQHLHATLVPGADGARLLDLTHLRSLQQLVWDYVRKHVWDGYSDQGHGISTVALDVMLPQQLQELKVASPLPKLLLPAAGAGSGFSSGFKALGSLHVEAAGGDARNLETLLSVLQPLDLQILLTQSAPGDFTGAQLWQTVSALGAATRLTSLVVSMQGLDRLEGDTRDLPAVEWCQPLLGLTDLRVLKLLGRRYQCPLWSGDVLHLTRLTSLAHLSLIYSEGVNDAAAVALAVNLSQLTHLDLHSNSLVTPAVLPALAAVGKLRHLQLWGLNFKVTDDELLMLTALTLLTSITLPAKECTAEASGSHYSVAAHYQRLTLGIQLFDGQEKTSIVRATEQLNC